MANKRIKNASIKFLNPFFGDIGRLPKVEITLPFKVTVEDPVTDETKACELIEFIRFDGIIPNVLCCHAEGKEFDHIKESLISEHQVSSVDELCYYLYKVL
jgi:hypothetical protein